MPLGRPEDPQVTSGATRDGIRVHLARGRPEDVQATFVATLVDEWARGGLRHAVVCPGSRSTPLALAFASHEGVTVHVHHDERSGCFLALGLARGGDLGAPVAVVTTSGTAAAELHPAVVEAHHAGVPLLVCTADRPPELQDVGAPQTIDQTHLFGRAVRWFTDPGVAAEAAAPSWRGLASRALAEAGGPPAGPVHLNLPFREPLVGAPGLLPEPRPERSATASDSRPGGRPWMASHHPATLGSRAQSDMVLRLLGRPGLVLAGEGSGPEVSELVRRLLGRRGLILAGEGSGTEAVGLAAALGWPIAADPRSRAWGPGPVNVPCLDAILRSEGVRSRLQPEAVLRLGEPPASRVVNDTVAGWCAAGGTEEVVVSATRWSDPAGTAALVVRADPAVVAGELLALVSEDMGAQSEPGAAGQPAEPAESVAPAQPGDAGSWQAAWRAVSDTAAEALRMALEKLPAPNEPAVARDLVAALPEDTPLVVSSSMPIRDVERYAVPRWDVQVLANRGANGIDGVVSTAVGVAAGSGRPTGLLVGDVAFLHDSNGLLGAADRGIDLVAVVVDNDGGGIFSFLPQASQLPGARFERLFGTPHGLDLAALARAYGVQAEQVDGDLIKHVEDAFGRGGVHVLVVRTDRAANVDVHRFLDEAITDAL